MSGFGIYAYTHTMSERDKGEYRMRVDWDAAGQGVTRPPAEFFNELEEETSAIPYLAPLAIALVVIAVLVVVAWRWQGAKDQ